MDGSPDLTVVVPMRNAADTVAGVVVPFLEVTSRRVEVVAVDDASTDDSVARLTALGSPQVHVVRLRESRGAGHARNVGFARARGTHTLFFDADDQVHPDALVAALDALDDTRADVAFLPYRYRRGHTTTFEGMNSFDDVVWSQYATASRVRTTLDQVPRLLGFSNYPWNKVLRTDHYRARGLRFSATPVHNDILGHWITLLAARSLVLVDAPLCTHVVAEGGENLTNHRSARRLALFPALDDTYAYLRADPTLRNRYSHHYWDFALRVAAWAAPRIDPEHAAEFDRRLQEHLVTMDLLDYSRIRQRRDPGLADRILRRALA